MGSEALVHSTKRSDWMTPKPFLERVSRVGAMMLDPCAPLDPRNWFAANNVAGPGNRYHLTETRFGDDGSRRPVNDVCDDGLELDWLRFAGNGLVYVNPPYGGRKKIIDAWIAKIVIEASRGCQIVGLVPASTGARWFADGIWGTAQAACFVRGRMRFIEPGRGVGNSATFWSVAAYWGQGRERFFDAFEDCGELARLNAAPHQGAALVPGADDGQ